MRRAAGAGLALALAALLSACNQSGQQIAPGISLATRNQPIAPGTTRVSIDNPNAEKWTAVVRQGAPDGSVRNGYTCKVLACPEPASVVVTTRRSPTANPDPKAIEKLARESIPKLVQAENLQLQVRTDNKGRVESLSSAVTRVDGYQAIFSESKLTIGDRARFIAVMMVFAGRVIINIRAEAADRAVAKTAADDFSRAFKVEDGPPLASGS